MKRGKCFCARIGFAIFSTASVLGVMYAGKKIIAPWLISRCYVGNQNLQFIVNMLVPLVCAIIAAWMIHAWVQAGKLLNSKPPPLP